MSAGVFEDVAVGFGQGLPGGQMVAGEGHETVELAARLVGELW